MELTQQQIAAVLEANPDLTLDGIGASDDRGIHWSTRPTAEFAVQRRELCVVSLDRLERAATWLNAWPRTKHINSRIGSSYGLKHVFERDTEEYIENGAFILAGLLTGLRIKRYPGSPNVHFNLGVRK